MTEAIAGTGARGNEDLEILTPMIEDRALMALIKQRHVPFSFIVKRLFRKPDLETSMAVVRALVALRPGKEHRQVAGVFELDFHFAMIQDVLHVCGGVLGGGGRSGEAFQTVTEEQVREALSTKSRAAGRKFAAEKYEQLKEMTDLYERVMRECERSINLAEALQRAKIEPEKWNLIKSWMLRFGLMRDPAYAKSILLQGPLAKEIEQRYVGDRLEDVVHQLLKDVIFAPRPVEAH